MNALTRQKLCELIGRYGTVLCEDVSRCEQLLREQCPGDLPDVRALVSALQAGLVIELRDAPASEPLEQTMAGLIKRLEEEGKPGREMARWVMETWALALGKVTKAKLPLLTASLMKPEEGSNAKKKVAIKPPVLPPRNVAHSLARHPGASHGPPAVPGGTGAPASPPKPRPAVPVPGSGPPVPGTAVPPGEGKGAAPHPGVHSAPESPKPVQPGPSHASSPRPAAMDTLAVRPVVAGGSAAGELPDAKVPVARAAPAPHLVPAPHPPRRTAVGLALLVVVLLLLGATAWWRFFLEMRHESETLGDKQKRRRKRFSPGGAGQGARPQIRGAKKGQAGASSSAP